MGGGNKSSGRGKGHGQNHPKLARWTCEICNYNHPGSHSFCSWCYNPTSTPTSTSTRHSPPKRSRWSRWRDRSADLGHGPGVESRSFDIATPISPPTKETFTVLNWLREQNGVDPTVFALLERAAAASVPPSPPKEPWKDLQSSHAKLKALESQISKADDRINKLADDLQDAQELKASLIDKKKEVSSHIESIMPGSLSGKTNAHHAGYEDQSRYYEKIIRSLQSKLSAGLPAAGSKDQTELYDTLFHGKLPDDDLPDDISINSSKVNDSEHHAGSEPPAATSDVPAAPADVAPATPAAAAADPSSLVVDKDGFGFNPAPKRVSRLGTPYTRQRARSLDGDQRPLFAARAVPFAPASSKETA